MNAGRLANTLQLTWKAMRLAWIVLKIVINLLCVVVGLAGVVRTTAVMLVSVMRVFLPRT